MWIDRLLYPVITLGPGERVAVWTSGCSKRCLGCANPELWDVDASKGIASDKVAAMLLALSKQHGAHRLTLTGGDPLEQVEELVATLEAVRASYDDILLYTGYTLDEARTLLGDTMSRIECLVDVIIDGRYVRELNDGRVPLRGSTNQVVHYLTPALREEYEAYMALGRSVQNFFFDGKAISVGIHGEANNGS